MDSNSHQHKRLATYQIDIAKLIVACAQLGGDVVSMMSRIVVMMVEVVQVMVKVMRMIEMVQMMVVIS